MRGAGAAVGGLGLLSMEPGSEAWGGRYSGPGSGNFPVTVWGTLTGRIGSTFRYHPRPCEEAQVCHLMRYEAKRVARCATGAAPRDGGRAVAWTRGCKCGWWGRIIEYEAASFCRMGASWAEGVGCGRNAFAGTMSKGYFSVWQRVWISMST